MSDISKERVGAISDGVIAVAATLLVLELKVPEGAIAHSEAIMHWSRLMAAWLISFAMIAMVWFDNHLFLVKAPRWTARMTIVTFAQLAAVSLIPFVCNLAVDHHQEIEAIIAFNIVMLINGIISVALGRMIAADIGRGKSSEGGQLLKRRAQLQLRIYVVISAVAVAGAFMHRPFLGVLLWGLSPLMIRYFLAERSADELVVQ